MPRLLSCSNKAGAHTLLPLDLEISNFFHTTTRPSNLISTHHTSQPSDRRMAAASSASATAARVRCSLSARRLPPHKPHTSRYIDAHPPTHQRKPTDGRTQPGRGEPPGEAGAGPGASGQPGFEMREPDVREGKLKQARERQARAGVCGVAWQMDWLGCDAIDA